MCAPGSSPPTPAAQQELKSLTPQNQQTQQTQQNSVPPGAHGSAARGAHRQDADTPEEPGRTGGTGKNRRNQEEPEEPGAAALTVQRSRDAAGIIDPPRESACPPESRGRGRGGRGCCCCWGIIRLSVTITRRGGGERGRGEGGGGRHLSQLETEALIVAGNQTVSVSAGCVWASGRRSHFTRKPSEIPEIIKIYLKLPPPPVSSSLLNM